MEEPIRVWRSAYELYTCSLAAPEVTGTPAYSGSAGHGDRAGRLLHPCAPLRRRWATPPQSGADTGIRACPTPCPKVSGRVIMRELLHEMHQRIFGRDV
ncbi:MAG: hypothetical protein ACLUSL_08470 [Ruminococcus sp.]